MHDDFNPQKARRHPREIAIAREKHRTGSFSRRGDPQVVFTGVVPALLIFEIEVRILEHDVWVSSVDADQLGENLFQAS
ncbi:MAG TPA: hypothetical protein VNH11_10155 [Pirellulales bacterium]|nr:hypothetical protein [Pirellulales bacterium]